MPGGEKWEEAERIIITRERQKGSRLTRIIVGKSHDMSPVDELALLVTGFVAYEREIGASVTFDQWVDLWKVLAEARKFKTEK